MSPSVCSKSGPVSAELQNHLDRILSTPRLTVDEERRLMKRLFDQGDQRAADRIIETHLRFVVAIALRYRNYPIAMSDLVSEGTLGLMVALGKFDCSRQTRFVTYASFWIRAYILDLVIRSWHSGKHGTGPFRSKVFFKLRREHARLSSRFGNAPEGIRYMAWQMGLTEEGLRDMLHQIELGDVSIDQLLCDDRPATIKDMLADKNPDPEQEVCSRREALFTRKIVEEALAVLDERERHVVRVRLMADEPETLATVGETLGVSRERARQLEVRARKKLGAHLARSMQSHSTAVA